MPAQLAAWLKGLKSNYGRKFLIDLLFRHFETSLNKAFCDNYLCLIIFNDFY